LPPCVWRDVIRHDMQSFRQEQHRAFRADDACADDGDILN
jgi:hypothetical protein